MNSFIADFNVSGKMRQKILITKAGWTPDMVVDGLNAGTLETTVSHDGVTTAGLTITDLEGAIIGRIQQQRAVEGMALFGYDDSTDIDLDMLGSDVEDQDYQTPLNL
jgi:hypothetical protein